MAIKSKQINAKHKQVRSDHIGGGGCLSSAAEIGISTHPPAAPATTASDAAQLRQAAQATQATPATQPAAASPTSQPASLHQPPATPPAWQPPAAPQMLPVGRNLPAASKLRLRRLSQLYAELKAAEAACYWTKRYLPKLRNSGEYVTDSMANHIASLKQQIADLAKPPAEGKPWPHSSKSPAKR